MDDPTPAIAIDLMELRTSIPALTPSAGESLAEAASLCLEEQLHGIETSVRVTGTFDSSILLRRIEITDAIRRCYNDPDDATELGACGIGILILRHLTGYSAIERSRKGSGFDYWLGSVASLPFQKKAR